MKTMLFIFALAVALTGCASTNDYALYADGQARADIARHTADAAKYKAMADIAAGGTEAAKVAAVMALMGQGGQPQAARLQAPQASEALQWASILVPGLTQIAGIAANASTARAQGQNAGRIAESTNNAFVGIAGKIQAPAAAAANVSNVSNVSSVANTTTSTSTDRHDTVATTDRHDSTAATHQTATTLSGTGTIGGGAYSTVANPITTAITDRHDVVTPAPVIAPVVPIVPVVVLPVASPGPL